MNRSPAPIAYLPLIIVFLLFGGGGLIILLTSYEPNLGPRWLFFFLIVITFTGLALPVSIFLNQRFPTHPPASPNTVVREALIAGIFVSTLAWLTNGRVLNFSLALIFFVGFTAIEISWRVWEQSKWRKP
ncbi:MAG: hypothetical protein HON98_09380 [Chloroflexi bacterium]|jgi:hypothetical protein|nr:hypothetical protein [Chloroflexota bacterium]MBT3670979.1 hypothetical protein [Chloroflexota bacterium]MBT4001746.1 hypothetical protein [Chloroflexota bacterium]MBT4305012.1 hypothetical protein [Chloroflexota bacterium]MBT4533823.1 hypothetical protein [Chloroflexota bacterium]